MSLHRIKQKSKFENFEKVFKPDAETFSGKIYEESTLLSCSGYKEFAAKYAGASFNKGIFRFYDAKTGPVMQYILEGAFFETKTSHFKVFASDWLGRQYAVTSKVAKDEEPEVVMFEIEENEIYKTSYTFSSFLNAGLYEMCDRTVYFDLFEKWAKENDTSSLKNPYKCAGLKIPLILGGHAGFGNMEVVDMEVYWDLTSQIHYSVS